MDRLRGKINSRGEPKLSAQALQWPTPAAQNWKGSSEASVIRADGKSRMDILHYRAEQGFTHPAPAIMPHGPQPSHHAPIPADDHVAIVIAVQIGDFAQQSDGFIAGGDAFGLPSGGDCVLFELVALGGIKRHG